MTFDREPDLDNANVGMPDTGRIFAEATKQGYFRFVRLWEKRRADRNLVNIMSKTVWEKEKRYEKK